MNEEELEERMKIHEYLKNQKKADHLYYLPYMNTVKIISIYDGDTFTGIGIFADYNRRNFGKKTSEEDEEEDEDGDEKKKSSRSSRTDETFSSKILPKSRNAKISMRIIGVDCPEIKGREDYEKKAAIAIRDYFRLRLLGKIVKIEGTECDKYGRHLCKVYFDDKEEEHKDDVASFLLRHQLARPYEGDTREPFGELECARICEICEILTEEYNLQNCLPTEE